MIILLREKVIKFENILKPEIEKIRKIKVNLERLKERLQLLLGHENPNSLIGKLVCKIDDRFKNNKKWLANNF